MGRFRKV